MRNGEIAMAYGLLKICRFCGCQYRAKYDSEKDGFCCTAHRQAAYRARKKYALRKLELKGLDDIDMRNAKKRASKKNSLTSS